MFYNNCCNTTDNRSIKRWVREAEVAASKACEAAKVAEASVCRAASLAKAAEEAACQAEHAAKVAREAASAAEQIAEKVRCMIDEYLSANSGCGCDSNYGAYPRRNGCNNDCDCDC